MLDGCASVADDCEVVFDPCEVSREQFIAQALKLLPPGQLWQGRCDCNFTMLFCAIAGVYYDQWSRACSVRGEVSPCTATDTLSEWAEIFQPICDDLPEEPAELRDLLCSLLQSRGQLTSQLIRDLLAAQGYNVLTIEPDRTFGSVTTFTACGFKLGHSPLGNFSLVRTKECRHTFAGLPCTEGCCTEEDEPETAQGNPCDPQLNEGACSSSGCTCTTSGLGNFTETSSTGQQLINPWTLLVTIDPNSPTILADPDFICYQWQAGSVLPRNNNLGNFEGCSEDLTIESCAIEALRPAHLTIRYRVECDV